MNLYLLTQSLYGGYDTYDSCVVVAKSEADAKLIGPDGKALEDDGEEWGWPSLSQIDSISAQYLGKASNELAKGVVCSSFNAG